MFNLKSISSKVTFVLFVSILVVMAFSAIMIYNIDSYTYKKRMDQTANTTVRRLENSLKNPVWTYDMKEIETIINIELENVDISGIVVFDNNNIYLFGKFKNFEINKTNYVEHLKKLARSPILPKKGKIEKHNVVIGIIYIYFTDANLKKTLNSLLRKILFQTILLTIILILVVYFTISKIIINPIIYLNRVVGKFSEKDFNVRSELNMDDELGSLSNNFNEMAITIKEYSEHLEDLVEKRTEELNRANKELLEANQIMKRELIMAQKIQQSMIPKVFPDLNSINLDGKCVPMANLGGDYYDVIKISDTKFALVIADVCGHGVPAALITTMAKISFYNNTIEGKSTGEIVESVNKELFSVIGNMEYLTAFYCIIDMENRVIHYTNAAHNPIYLVKSDKEIVRLEQNSVIIGFVTDFSFSTDEISFDVGDRLVLYTDGIPETRDEKNELFGYERLENFLMKNKNIPISEMINKLFSDLDDFRGNKKDVDDDITILVVDFLDSKNEITIDYEVRSEKKKII